MHLPEETARKIINLNPYPKKQIIDQDIADRQFQVILQGFNYLLQPENKFLYIGDEVGLGKTYIALGIASLLRLYSNNPETYVDTILVPKKNLQYKWSKEIRNFINHNYTQKDNIVKSVLNLPVGQFNQKNIKGALSGFEGNKPQYIIYRNSSFSIGSNNNDDNKKGWIDRLAEKLKDEQKPLFNQVAKKFRTNHILIKRAFAYLLNESLPEIDLLIVDEAHNFRHGLGKDVSIRNQVVSRILGINNDDEELFEHFPELKATSKPKVKKLLLLSATPINNSLLEIKNQLDCFLPKHRLSNLLQGKEDEDIIKKSINEFMIRGVMTVNVNNTPYSRNGYRHEHRNGNVEMSESAKRQELKDNATSLVLCLMQYKTIKELKLKSGNQFEMGMLAGFESFQKSATAYEDDTLSSRKEREAKDESVLKEIIESYNAEFKNYPPHPKQESLVEELFQLMIKREKSLVFVRRIASVRELERKLFKKYSDYLIEKIKKVTKGKTINSIEVLFENYKNEFIREQIEATLDTLEDRIKYDLRKLENYKPENDETIEQVISKDLREIFYSLVENEEISNFRKEVENHIKLKIIRTELKELAKSLIIKKWDGNLVLIDEDEEDDENTILDDYHDEERAPYFFQRFFYNEGKKFKNKSYKKDWYELNLLLINDKFNLFKLENKSKICRKYDFFNEPVDIKKFKAITDKTIEAIKSDQITDFSINNTFRTNTFLSELLLNLCKDEFSIWIDNYKGLIRDNYYTAFLKELDTLNEILKSIFRQGSGLLIAFIADAKTTKSNNNDDDDKRDTRSEFINEMKSLLLGEFNFVLDEIKQILKDYEKLVERNFDDKDKIKYNLIQQLPVSGVSGHHKRNVRKTAIQFRMPGYPYVLITTDILKEGEDLHSYCKNIYHYGIAWNPSDMEQRTGRIDRVDSLVYRKIKEVENQQLTEIPFQNKLQVFYPYLADTLEVNQMIRLFNGMDKFIEIFYNDLSANLEKSSKARVDEIIVDIPEQRKGLLKSKYDHDSFQNNFNGEKLEIKQAIGTSIDELSENLQLVLNGLGKYEYIIKPEFDNQNMTISGIMDLNGRKGPFNLYLKQSKLPGEFEYVMDSLVGKVQTVGRTSNKAKLLEKLEEKNLQENITIEIKESNSDVFLFTNAEYSLKIDKLLNRLYNLVVITDEIEEDVLGTDENPE